MPQGCLRFVIVVFPDHTCTHLLFLRFHQDGSPFVDLLCVFCLVFVMPLRASVYLWSPAGKGLTSWLSFVVYNCEFVTFPLVSWVIVSIPDLSTFSYFATHNL